MKTKTSKYNSRIAKMNAALKRCTHLPFIMRRTRRGWEAFLPGDISPDGAGIGVSSATLPSFYGNSRRKFRENLCTRYLADLYDENGYINLRVALRLPNWSSGCGALGEIADCMERAGLI